MSREELESIAFNETFHRIRMDLIASERNEEVVEALKWFDKVIMYNVPNGKKNRGMAVTMSYRKLASPSDLVNPDNLEAARIVGWCVELLQTYYLIVDDIMDGSVMRRDQLCWYRQEGVGLMAINDALCMEAGLYQLLKIHFQHQPFYSKIMDLFLTTTRLTIYGQTLDLLSTPPGRSIDLTRFTMERYFNIIKYKTGYYSFSLPVRAAMFLAGKTDEKSHREAEAVLLKMGRFFQVQDDYLDCYGDPKITGKIGTDIQDGKCSWPIVTALTICNKNQLEILQNNYGRNDQTCVEEVKSVYNELDIVSKYLEFEEQQYQEICIDINDLNQRTDLPGSIFHNFLAKIYRRNK